MARRIDPFVPYSEQLDALRRKRYAYRVEKGLVVNLKHRFHNPYITLSPDTKFSVGDPIIPFFNPCLAEFHIIHAETGYHEAPLEDFKERMDRAWEWARETFGLSSEHMARMKETTRCFPWELLASESFVRDLAAASNYSLETVRAILEDEEPK